jgi:hypothetical protein
MLSSYWMMMETKKRILKLKEEALDCILRRTHCGRGNGPVIRQAME